MGLRGYYGQAVISAEVQLRAGEVDTSTDRSHQVYYVLRRTTQAAFFAFTRERLGRVSNELRRRVRGRYFYEVSVD